MPGGRPRKPTALKLLQGTHRKDRAPKNEPKPPAGDRPPSPPSFLAGLALKEWKRLANRLHSVGLLTEVDRSKFAMYCQAYARWQECEAVISAEGMTIETATGYVQQRPEVSIAHKYCEIAQKLGQQFGIDPAARSRIDVPPAPEKPAEDEDAWGRALKGKKA
jgi:P27 family predicted phage terminase small subunit